MPTTDVVDNPDLNPKIDHKDEVEEKNRAVSDPDNTTNPKITTPGSGGDAATSADDGDADEDAEETLVIRKRTADTSADKSQLSKFLKLSGYKAGDVLDSHKGRRTFVTSNGGKYALSPKGTRVRTLSGPPTPKELEVIEEDDE